MGPLDKSEWKAIVLGWSLRPLRLLLKKVCQQPSFKKNIYFNLSFMHFYNISISLRATTANTFLKKSEKVPVWCQFSLHLRNTIDFLRPFLLELEKMHFLALFYASRQCIFSWDLKNFWILDHIFFKKSSTYSLFAQRYWQLINKRLPLNVAIHHY